jgi:hypothetical protein
MKRPENTWKFGIVLSSIGVGYLAIEIALMQKFGLFLGHPNYAISVVLASILLATGLGSLYSDFILKNIAKVRYVSYILAFVIFSEYFLVLPHLLSLVGLNFAFKLIIVFILVFPIGILLGVFMPATLERLKISAPSYVPWGWGINGIFSVLAPILCIGISVTWGINALLLSAVFIYLVAGLFFPEQANN